MSMNIARPINARTPSATPTPIPAFAPVERPELSSEAAPGDEVADAPDVAAFADETTVEGAAVESEGAALEEVEKRERSLC